MVGGKLFDAEREDNLTVFFRIMKNLGPQTQQLILEGDKQLYSSIYKEVNNGQFFHEISKAGSNFNSLESTFSCLTNRVNKHNLSDVLFGLWKGSKCNSYALKVACEWEE
jgi:hypothetical protein